MDAIRTAHLTKQYAGGVQALRDVNLTVKKGQFFALLGPNGAGKTTLISILSTLTNKSAGKVWILGHDLDTQTREAKQHLGLVPQEFNFSIFESVEQILLDNAGYYGVPRAKAKQRAETWLKRVDLWEKRHTASNRLSGGMKRCLMIARAMMHAPKILVLDEPTAGIDLDARHKMWALFRTINKEGVTIILTTHYLEEADQLCDYIVIIDKGQVVTNTDKTTLLNKRHKQIFIMELTADLQTVPWAPTSPLSHRITQQDARTLTLEVDATFSLSDAFALLHTHAICVAHISSKTNRLEQRFLELTTT